MHLCVTYVPLEEPFGALQGQVHTQISQLPVEEASLEGDIPLMFTPAVTFRLLIHGIPFSGNDSLRTNLKSCFEPIWGLKGRISECTVLFLRAKAFGLSWGDFCIVY